jgi:hypothetical protein
MLKSALVAMTILGCNCEQNTCEYIRTADLDLANIADCRTRMRSEIEKTNADYPLVVAVCENHWDPTAAAAIVTSDAPAPTPKVQSTEAHVERSILIKARERYSAIMTTARDGLDGAADFVTVPAAWLQRQLSAIDLEW